MLARSPNKKWALQYLAASGATPITVTEHDGVATVHTGKTTGPVAGRWWIASRDAVCVAAHPSRRAVDAQYRH